MRLRFIILALVLSLSTCVSKGDWVSPLERDHPLVGSIWSPAARHFISRQDLEKAAQAADFVLLGEKHDNADHHLLQAQIVTAMAKMGRKPAIVMEMIDEEKQLDIDKWRSSGPANAGELGNAVSWEKSGWPDWSFYRPIADAAVTAILPIRAGNISRRRTRIISRKGIAEIAASRRDRLGLDIPLVKKIENQLRDELFESHCRLMPRRVLSPMINVQRVRDAFLADNLVTGAVLPNADSGVLIAGTGHVRNDYAVPVYLKRLRKDAKIMSVAFVEVENSANHPKDYGNHFNGSLPFDFIWFTPRADDKDHCTELKERFGKRKPKKK